jgi:hypothetical protein
MFGTRSDQGERAVERLLTVARTCQVRQLSRSSPPASGAIIAETLSHP